MFEGVSRLMQEVNAYINEAMMEDEQEEEGVDEQEQLARPKRFANPLLAESYIFELVQKIESECVAFGCV